MSNNTRRAAPRPAKPVGRYWKGKAPQGITTALSDSEEEDAQEAQRLPEEGDVPLGEAELDTKSEGDEEDEPAGLSLRPKVEATKTMNIALRNVDISEEGKVIVAGREESGRTVLEASEDEEEDEEEEAPVAADGAEEESSEYESESEEEEPAGSMYRPVFVPKRARATAQEKEADFQESEEAAKRQEMEAEERREQSRNMVAESIKRELAEKEKEEEQPDIDDSDGVDPTAEFEAWRLRELNRIKRDKEEQLRRDQEREEIERRRALPEEQRLKEDMEHAKQSRDAKPKGKQKFLQKYWHKGAFHQDSEILKKHDYTEATESTVDISLLPKVMQVRDFGKRSRTKYTHLVDQDTTAGNGGFGGAKLYKPGAKVGEPGGGCFSCGGPHLKRDCPQNAGPIRSGANNSEPKGSWRWPTDQNGPDSPRRERKTSPHRRDLPPRGHDRDRRDYRREDRKEDGHFDNRDNRYDGRRSSRFDDRREQEYDRDNRSRRVYSPPPARGDRRRSRERSPDDRKRRRVD